MSLKLIHMKITNYVPTAVGPTKLEKTLGFCTQLDDVGKEKVCVIQDIAKLLKLLNHKPIDTERFYAMYEVWSMYQLTVYQMELTNEVRSRSFSQPIQGADF